LITACQNEIARLMNCASAQTKSHAGIR
jgi:hypothetical protein